MIDLWENSGEILSIDVDGSYSKVKYGAKAFSPEQRKELEEKVPRRILSEIRDEGYRGYVTQWLERNFDRIKFKVEGLEDEGEGERYKARAYLKPSDREFGNIVFNDEMEVVDSYIKKKNIPSYPKDYKKVWGNYSR